MNVLVALIVWAVFGLIAGAVARLLVPGRQPIGLGMTIALGIAGSFLGGFLGWLVIGTGDPLQASNMLLSIAGAALLLVLFVGMSRRRVGRHSY
ncbi:MAG: GlsB/YeaQ/YmgE family stress response membrane protein [Planctomycetes bacterium]|nr:GlsB/YeaQ/YmgE family stress response membrane protein [Planctomycetota bacterium]